MGHEKTDFQTLFRGKNRQKTQKYILFAKFDFFKKNISYKKNIKLYVFITAEYTFGGFPKSITSWITILPTRRINRAATISVCKGCYSLYDIKLQGRTK